MQKHASTRALAALLAAAALAACSDDELPTAVSPGAGAPALDISGGTEVRITNNTAGQWVPAIDGDRIVWGDGRLGLNARDIFMYDIATGTETALVTAAGTQQNPRISGDLVAYEDWGTTVEVRIHNVVTGQNVQASSGPGGSESYPSISGTRVIFQSNRNSNHDLYVYDLATGVESPLRVDAPGATPKATSHTPVISGTRVVWVENWGGADDPDIMLGDVLGGTPVQLTDNVSWQGAPWIDGDRVVWEDNRDGNVEVYLYDIPTATRRRITNHPARQRNPRISGDVIVWEDYRHGDSNVEIYAFDLSANAEYRITSNTSQQGAPMISNGRIVWQDGRHNGGSGNSEIYMYVPPAVLQSVQAAGYAIR